MQMQQGLQLNIRNEMREMKPGIVTVFNKPPEVADRIPPVRYRANIATSWIKIILKEGKNRQIRKMTAKVGFPTLRLIRYRIVDIELKNMQPSTMIELSQKSIYKKLFHATNI
jgi:23S rRNA pseudouridine2457 synthase